MATSLITAGVNVHVNVHVNVRSRSLKWKNVTFARHDIKFTAIFFFRFRMSFKECIFFTLI